MACQIELHMKILQQIYRSHGISSNEVDIDITDRNPTRHVVQMTLSVEGIEKEMAHQGLSGQF